MISIEIQPEERTLGIEVCNVEGSLLSEPLSSIESGLFTQYTARGDVTLLAPCTYYRL